MVDQPAEMGLRIVDPRVEMELLGVDPLVRVVDALVDTGDVASQRR